MFGNKIPRVHPTGSVRVLQKLKYNPQNVIIFAANYFLYILKD